MVDVADLLKTGGQLAYNVFDTFREDAGNAFESFFVPVDRLDAALRAKGLPGRLVSPGHLIVGAERGDRIYQGLKKTTIDFLREEPDSKLVQYEKSLIEGILLADEAVGQAKQGYDAAKQVKGKLLRAGEDLKAADMQALVSQAESKFEEAKAKKLALEASKEAVQESRG